MPETKPQCAQYIVEERTGGVRRCSRKATHVSKRTLEPSTCAQHAHSYDMPMPKGWSR